MKKLLKLKSLSWDHPRNDNMAVMPIINSVNATIAKLATEKDRYLNINDKLAAKTASCMKA